MSLLDDFEYFISSVQKYHPERFISEKNIVPEDDYNYILTRYLKSNPDETEYDFLDNHINRAKEAIKELEEINEDLLLEVINKETPRTGNEIEFVDHELKRWKSKILEGKKEYKTVVHQLELRKSRLPQPIKKSKSLRVNGKNLNLLDRWNIANQKIDLEGLVGKLNSSDDSKYKLLAAILGCSPINARQLVNGNYDVKPHTDLVEKFIASLN